MCTKNKKCQITLTVAHQGGPADMAAGGGDGGMPDPLPVRVPRQVKPESSSEEEEEEQDKGRAVQGQVRGPP